MLNIYLFTLLYILWFISVVSLELIKCVVLILLNKCEILIRNIILYSVKHVSSTFWEKKLLKWNGIF